jgi:hypothetical protein
MATERIEVRLNPQVDIEQQILGLIEGPGSEVAYGAKSRFLKERLIAGLRDLLDEVEALRTEQGGAESAVQYVQSNAYRYDAVHYTALISLLGGAAREPREPRAKDVRSVEVATATAPAAVQPSSAPPVAEAQPDPVAVSAAEVSVDEPAHAGTDMGEPVAGPGLGGAGLDESGALEGQGGEAAPEPAAPPARARWGHMSGIAGQRRG